MTMDPTKLDFVSLQVADLKKSKDFYTNLLSFEVGPSPNPDAIVFKNSDGSIFAVRKPLIDLATVPQLGAGVALWFAVPNVESVYEQALESGVKIVATPTDSPFGKTIIVSDPDGYAITLHQSQA
jgi:predicted enzyme related to lactoylglutathione lyase